MIKYMTDMEIQLAQIVKELRMQVAALEVAMADLEDRGWVGLTDEEIYEAERIACIKHDRHMHSTRGQQLTPADEQSWHFARAIEQALKDKNK